MLSIPNESNFDADILTVCLIVFIVVSFASIFFVDYITVKIWIAIYDLDDEIIMVSSKRGELSNGQILPEIVSFIRFLAVVGITIGITSIVAISMKKRKNKKALHE